jgi:hypothetical protein
MLKRLLVALSFIAPPVSAYSEPAVELSSLSDVENALNRGAEVSVTVDLTKCSPAAGTTSPGTVRGGLKINAYRILPDGTLSFSDEEATDDPGGQPFWQLLRYQVRSDQTVSFTVDLFSLPSFARLAPQIGYTCAVDQGIAFFTERNS